MVPVWRDGVIYLFCRGGFAAVSLKPSPWGEGAPVRTLGRMRGQILDWVCCMRRDFAAPAASFFPSDGKETKGSPGTAPDEHFVLIVAFPRTPLRGTRTCVSIENFRRAKFEWLLSFYSGPQGPEFAKISAGAVPRLRLVWPSKRSRCVFWREPQGPSLPKPKRLS